MRHFKSRTVSILLSLVMVITLSPTQIIYAITDNDDLNTEASASAEVSEYSDKSENSVNDVNGLESDANSLTDNTSN